MIQLNPKKVANLHNTSELLESKYGKYGSNVREIFNEKALASYYTDLLKGRRKELKITQKELAGKTGKERSYIAKIEKGETDMQLSSFITISRALGLKFALV